MREAPSRVIITELIRRGASICAYDPVAMPEAQRTLDGVPRLTYANSQAQALEGADALVIITEWKEFKSPDFDAMKAALKQPVVIDGRNLYEPSLMAELSIEYNGIGRSTHTPR